MVATIVIRMPHEEQLLAYAKTPTPDEGQKRLPTWRMGHAHLRRKANRPDLKGAIREVAVLAVWKRKVLAEPAKLLEYVPSIRDIACPIGPRCVIRQAVFIQP